MSGYELIFFVLNAEYATKALKIAKQHGIKGGTICMARGSVNSKILELLDLNDSHNELLMTVSESSVAEEAMLAVAHEMRFDKPRRGIAFSIPLSHFVGTRHYDFNDGGKTMDSTAASRSEGRKAEAPQNGEAQVEAIFTIVDRGLGEDVMTAARLGGAKGGTIINARGSGIHEDSTVFAMPIEPEKEIVIILSKTESTETISKSIRSVMRIDEPNRGIVFVTPITKAVGLYE